MAERRWQAVIWIRCFTRRRFSSSRKNCMGVVPVKFQFYPFILSIHLSAVQKEAELQKTFSPTLLFSVFFLPLHTQSVRPSISFVSVRRSCSRACSPPGLPLSPGRQTPAVP